MLIVRRAFLVCAIAGLIYALLAFSFAFYFSIAEQTNNYGPQYKYQAAYSIFVELFIGPFATIGRFILRHPELITALATVFIGWFTYALVQATKELTRIADQGEESTKTIERAYVTIVDISPGVSLSNNVFTLTAKIQNFGRTPAVVSDAPITIVVARVKELPTQPPYARRTAKDATHAFLVSGHHFMTSLVSSDNDPVITGEVVEAIQKGTKILHYVGYVDYIDKFGVRRRSGYGRTYNPVAASLGAHNLLFITQQGYNYDRERNKGEGNDWGNEAPI